MGGDYAKQRNAQSAGQQGRACIRGGEHRTTILRTIDCPIAVGSVRAGLPILRADAELALNARHTELTMVDV